MVTTFSRSPFMANELAELVNNKASTSDTGVGNLSLYEQWKEKYEDDPHKGYPIPTRPTGDFSRPFSTGEHSNHQNHRASVSTEGVFQNFSDFSLGSTGGIFRGLIRTTPLPNHGSDHGWGSGTDYRLRKLKMPLFNGDDVYDWVYQAERFYDIQGLFTTRERLRAVMMCLEGPAFSWSR
ncbi:hypothetical protein Tco_1122330 [Tanacetum coccineum]|uniref:Uncharacterized protein n=1 Tax=Tanacetum coccineum TaxID=301880 RepID=A0ABQ5J1V6_9ASTR